MNKNFTTILTTAAIALATGCATAGAWVNGTYIDGPLCTVCDGMRVIAHGYGTTVCTHCDGTGVEPPEETVIVENTVVVDTWCPPPRPPRWHHPRPIPHRNPSRMGRPPHGGGGHRDVRPARPAPRKAARPAARPAARSAAPRGGGGHGGGGARGGGRARR